MIITVKTKCFVSVRECQAAAGAPLLSMRNASSVGKCGKFLLLRSDVQTHESYFQTLSSKSLITAPYAAHIKAGGARPTNFQTATRQAAVQTYRQVPDTNSTIIRQSVVWETKTEISLPLSENELRTWSVRTGWLFVIAPQWTCTSVREVLGSNLGQGTGCNGNFRSFTVAKVTRLGQIPFFPHYSHRSS